MSLSGRGADGFCGADDLVEFTAHNHSISAHRYQVEAAPATIRNSSPFEMGQLRSKSLYH